MLCSSGGHFTKTQSGWEYSGGETRLVSVSSNCHMQELQDALHRVSKTMRLDLSSSSGTVSLAACSTLLLHVLLPCRMQVLKQPVGLQGGMKLNYNMLQP